MVGRQSFPIGKVTFQGRTGKTSNLREGRVLPPCFFMRHASCCSVEGHGSPMLADLAKQMILDLDCTCCQMHKGIMSLHFAIYEQTFETVNL